MAVNLDPSAIGGIIGAMIPTAAIGAGWLTRVIIKNRKTAARMIIAGLDPNSKEKENSDGDSTLNATILQMLRQLESERQDRRRTEERQWERIEQIAISCRDLAMLAGQHSKGLEATIQTVQNFALSMEHAHRYQTEQVAAVATNQIRLSEWVQARESLWNRPPYQQKSGN